VKLAGSRPDEPKQHFWQWRGSMAPYLRFLAAISFICGITTVLFCEYQIYEWLLGYLSGSIEALLGIPQMLHNHQRKNTEGLSRVMIAMWLIGDCYKMGYYLEVDAPVPLIVCSLFSIVVDSIILAQFCLYQEGSDSD
jgi:uncharacterized protein with PQ loop repeat